MHHPASDCRVLHPAFPEDPAFSPFVCMAELSLCTVCHNLYLTMRMERPDGSGRKSIVIEHPECTEMHVVGIVILVKRKMPSAMKRSILYFTVYLINGFRRTNYYLGHTPCLVVIKIILVKTEIKRNI